MSPEVVSVSEFVAILNETLGFAFPRVVVEGEVSDFRVTQNRWVSFNLKDETTTINCFLVLPQLKVPLEDGMKIRVTGAPRVYGKSGRLSFTVREIELAGEGAIRRAFELLRRQLEAEGLFSSERKRALPPYPTRIGLITSADSAAYADFMKILNGRWGGVTVEVAHVQVQGGPAPSQIVGAFEYFNQLAAPVDVVVLVRGGGSLEDLQAFNTEAVARAVATSRTPTVVGVGHEVDVSLADYAADVRAVTPTDAARLVVPSRPEETQKIATMTRRLESQLGQAVTARQAQVNQGLARIELFVRQPTEQVRRAHLLLIQAAGRLTSGLARYGDQVERLQTQTQTGWARLADQRRYLVAQLERVVRTTSPQATLARGYAIARHEGQILRNAANVQVGESVVVQLAKGNLKTKVHE